MTRIEFAQGMAMLSATVGREMPDTQVDAWYAILGKMTAEQLRKGIVESLKHHKFAGFPPVASILAAAGVVRDDHHMIAWATVRDAIRRVGAYDSCDFEDGAINATIRDLGGWVAICETASDEMQWLEKRFCEAYKSLSTVDLPSHLTARLPGINEIANGREEMGAVVDVVRVPLIGSSGVPERRRIGVQ